MDELTLTALEGSIKKWEAIVAGTGKDDGPDNCPLCRMFHDDYLTDADRQHGRRGCDGCPVYEKTKTYGCGGTPYDNWEDEDFPQDEVAKAELEFLRSLLP